MEELTVTGIILKVSNVSEYDKRIVILTKERGKIVAFAKGARKTNHRLLGITSPFLFGEFSVYEGRTAYQIKEATILNHFENLRNDYEAAFYGMYFLEISDYYSKENNDEVELLKLLYQTLQALNKTSIDKCLIQSIFEIKSICVNGEFPGILDKFNILEDTKFAIDYIVRTKIDKLYTFQVSKEVLAELCECAKEYRVHYMGGKFNSLEILQNCLLKNEL